ncbi:MAG: hypothetical protein JSS14_23260 [Proteobacteria bacterium]|nr:hypothetical protein [Pseudomonadota bacterium]
MKKNVACLALACAAAILTTAGCAATKSASRAVPLASMEAGEFTIVLTNDLSDATCTRAGSLRAWAMQASRVASTGCWKYLGEMKQVEVSFNGEVFHYTLTDFGVADPRAVRRATIEAEMEAENLAGRGWQSALRDVGAGMKTYADSQQEKARIYQQQSQRPWNQQFCSAVTNNCAVNVRIVP